SDLYFNFPVFTWIYLCYLIFSRFFLCFKNYSEELTINRAFNLLHGYVWRIWNNRFLSRWVDPGELWWKCLIYNHGNLLCDWHRDVPGLLSFAKERTGRIDSKKSW